MNLTAIARAIFAEDRYATQATGINIDQVCENTTVCSLNLTEMHRNAKGAVMGGVIFTLADFAFAIAANSGIIAAEGMEAKLQWVSSSSTIHFLSTAKGDRLTATTSPVKQGRTQAVYQINVTDSDGHQVALITTSGTKVNV